MYTFDALTAFAVHAPTGTGRSSYHTGMKSGMRVRVGGWGSGREGSRRVRVNTSVQVLAIGTSK